MLTTYQHNHLAPTYLIHGPALFGPTVHASRAHVIMLGERGLIPAARMRQLLVGLEKLRTEKPELPTYDGSFEDVYFAFELTLARAMGIEKSELDVQLARSRNDLDAGIFRMILREQVADVALALESLADHLLGRAHDFADVVVVGLTHRRPAQPTTMGHVLAGYAEAVIGELAGYNAVLAELDASPMGSCAFAGTDLDIDSPRLAQLLGFDRVITNSYEAVAGADHLIAVGQANARALATGARFARVLQDWMTWGWVQTAGEFTQGSSIMPQKRNPVVLEHLVSMAGATIADSSSVLANVSAAWWEDSNNATTDVQHRLWESNDRSRRFFTLLAGLVATLTVGTTPSAAEIVSTGATTTAAADVLAGAGVPFRAAHDVLGRLLREGPPAEWTVETVAAAAASVGSAAADVVDNDVARRMLSAALDPSTVTARRQPDGPGTGAVRAQTVRLRQRLDDLRGDRQQRQSRWAEAEEELARLVTEATS